MNKEFYALLWKHRRHNFHLILTSFFISYTHTFTHRQLSICLLQIMQETLSFFMFLLQVKDKNAETKQV